MSGDDAERAARAALVRAHEPGEPLLAAAVLRAGPIAVLEQWAAGGEVVVDDATGRPHVVDPGGALRRRLGRVDGRSELAAGAAAGARLVCPGDPEWPAGLDDLRGVAREQRAGPPIGLWVRGPARLHELLPGSVACVGSRAATGYGATVATELAADLADAGRTVVSGAAYGVDAAAHRGALAVGRPTVAVLACGVDVAYPRGHAQLLERVLDGGAVVSECPPGAVPHRARFLARNRLIAAMTAATVVVEAAVRSGALSTARWARDLQRPVGGVPGPVTSALSVGVHALLRSGDAALVTSAADVLELLGSGAGGADGPASAGLDRPWDDLDPTAATLLEAVPARGSVDVDVLVLRTGLRLGDCLRAVTVLVTRGLLVADGSGWRLAPGARRCGGA